MQVRVFVIMEDGVIQNVLADMDDPDVVEVVVVDYDTDGVPLEETTGVPQDDAAGKVTGYVRAVVSRWGSDGIETVGQALHDKAVKMFGAAG